MTTIVKKSRSKSAVSTSDPVSVLPKSTSKPKSKPKSVQQPPEKPVETVPETTTAQSNVSNVSNVSNESKPAEPAPAKRTRKPKAVPGESQPPPSSSEDEQKSVGSTEPVQGCQAVIGSGAKAGQACGCKVKFPSTDRCGRHMNGDPKPKTSSKTDHEEKEQGGGVKPKAPSKTKRTTTSASAKATKEAQLRTAVARLSLDSVTHIDINEFGNCIYPNTSIVIDQNDPHAIGSQKPDGTIKPLSVEEIEFCMRVFIPLKSLPVSLSSSNTNTGTDMDGTQTQVVESTRNEPGLDVVEEIDEEGDETDIEEEGDEED